MLNPNDGGCVLYPEEVDALLSTGTVARVENFKLDGERPIIVSDEANPPAWLVPVLKALYTKLATVKVAYLLQMAPLDRPLDRTLLIALGVRQADAKRAARATITVVQPLCSKSKTSLDLTTFDP